MDISSNDVASSPAGEGSRRKSGRAVRAPEKFAPSSQNGPSKRKRRGEEVEDNAEDSDEIDDDSDESIESAAEEELKDARKKAKKPAKKPAQKKPKVNGSQPGEDAAAVRLPNRAKKPKVISIADRSAGGLYGESICKHARWRLTVSSGCLYERGQLRRCCIALVDQV
jgi:cohesin complex subunit SA-1/2